MAGRRRAVYVACSHTHRRFDTIQTLGAPLRNFILHGPRGRSRRFLTARVTYETYERPLSLTSLNAGAHDFNLRITIQTFNRSTSRALDFQLTKYCLRGTSLGGH